MIIPPTREGTALARKGAVACAVREETMLVHAMATKITDAVIHEIDDIVRLSEALSRDASRAQSSLGPQRVEELRGVVTRLGHLVRLLSGRDGQHLADLEKIQSTKLFSTMHSNYFLHISELCGLAKAVQHQVQAGLFANVRGLVQAEVFDDFLEMSEHLLVEGYKDPAAVLVGAVLEDTLRKRAEQERLPTADSNGKTLTIDPLNVALAKAGVYNVLVQKQVTAWADLRNKAAHARWDQYDTEQVTQMLVGVRKFCADYLPS
jgi:hypothetical protein